MRILYLPIIEQSIYHEMALRSKRGLFNALSERAEVVQLDYLLELTEGKLLNHVREIVQNWKPDLLLTQFHGPSVSAAYLRELRALNPDMTLINWSGDLWEHSLTAPDFLDLCRAFDMQLMVVPEALPIYRAANIPAAYWQVGYEPPVNPLPDMPAYDVVFLGNATSKRRGELLELLRALPDWKIGIYGNWFQSNGDTRYDFAAGEALYKRAKLAIADLAYPDQPYRKYISNRTLQILGAGGALLLHQRIDDMMGLTGLVAGEHYSEWQDLGDLKSRIAFWLDPARENERRAMVWRGQFYTLAHHSYRARVEELFSKFMPGVSAQGSRLRVAA